MRGQVVNDFIVDHRIKDEEDVCHISVCSWKLYFDGSVCRDGQGISMFSRFMENFNVLMGC